jgi:hypothetical protein
VNGQRGVPEGTPVARDLERAVAAFRRGDAAGVDEAHRAAADKARSGDPDPDPDLWADLAVDHVGRLLALEAVTPALRRCGDYLRDLTNVTTARDDVRGELLLLQADCHCAAGAYGQASEVAVAIRAEIDAADGGAPTAPPAVRARLMRVEALAAADRGEAAAACRLLDDALVAADGAADTDLVLSFRQARVIIDVREGVEPAVAAAADPTAGSPAAFWDAMARAMALRQLQHYERSLEVVDDLAGRDGLDPALRHAVRREQADLAVLVKKKSGRTTPRSSQRGRAVTTGWTDTLVSARDRVADAEIALSERRPDLANRALLAAETLAGVLDPDRATPRQRATWLLTVGELFLTRSRAERLTGAAGSRDRLLRRLDEAACCLREAETLSGGTTTAEIRVLALVALGHALYEQARVNDDGSRDSRLEKALDCWHQAHELQETIVGYQRSDAVRLRMLAAADNEYDRQIEVVAGLKAEAPVPAPRSSHAAVVLALEAARGATILGALSPSGDLPARGLPRPLDVAGADAWVQEIVERLPQSQAVWMLHATADHLHHAVLRRGGRGADGVVLHESVPRRRDELNEAVRGFFSAIGHRDDVSAHEEDLAIHEEDLAKSFGGISRLVHPPDRLVESLTMGVTRLAVVAGGMLADVPFAALTWPDDPSPLGHRFAVSDLPCLLAGQLLDARSRGCRGDRSLLVWFSEATWKPEEKISRPQVPPRGVLLEGASASPSRLGEMLVATRPATVRLDCHGGFGSAGSPSWLQLAPDGPGGRLVPEAMRELDLRSCGTLVLGACESGMSEPLGRGERDGFVRAGYAAGAASVVAARWKAEDSVAAVVLNGFQRYQRYLPRDVALQRALHDVRDVRRLAWALETAGMTGTAEGAEAAGDGSLPLDVPGANDRAYWACWTLYGDSGWQTRAGVVRRAWRRLLVELSWRWWCLWHREEEEGRDDR